MEEIIKHFNRYLPLNEGEIAALTTRLFKRKIRRRQYILQEGTVCKDFTYIVEGCFKMYGVDDSGVGHNLLFAAEDDWIVDINSFYKVKASQLYIEAVEPSTILQLPKEDLFRDHPRIFE